MEAANYTVNEDAGSVWVCVELTSLPAGGLECEISVTLVTTDGAKAGIQSKEVGMHTHMGGCTQLEYVS